MDTFLKWLIGDMGTPGEYMYTAIHWYSLAAVVLLLVVLIVIQRRLNANEGRQCRLIVWISAVQLAFEILWRLIYLFVKKAPLNELWPSYPCNLGGILIPLVALFQWNTGKKLFYLFGFVGAVLTFALPEGIFCTDVMVFPVLKSILQHTGILLIPVLEYTGKTYRPRIRDFGWVVGGCLIHAINSEGISRLWGLTEDYMFFRSGLPFVIPGVPQFITLSVFALLVLALLCFISDFRGSVADLRACRKRKA